MGMVSASPALASLMGGVDTLSPPFYSHPSMLTSSQHPAPTNITIALAAARQRTKAAACALEQKHSAVDAVEI